MYMKINNKVITISLLLFLANQPLSSVELDHLELEPGFDVSVYALDLDAPRQMAEGKNGTIFVGERSGQVLALIDSDKNGQADLKIIQARDEAIREVKSKATDLSVIIAKKYLKENINDEISSDLIDKSIEDLKRNL